MGIETWAAIGIVCGAILALATVVAGAVKGLHVLWMKNRRLDDLLDQVKTANSQQAEANRQQALIIERLDATGDRLDLTNQRIDATNARLDAVEIALGFLTPAPPGTVPGKPTPPRRTR